MVRSSKAIAGDSRVMARQGDEGEGGGGSSHATHVKFVALCLCILGGGVGDVGVQRGEAMVGG